MAELMRPLSPDVAEVRVLDASIEELHQTSQKVGWGLSREELAVVKDHFRSRGRDPRDIEMEAIAQGWSEHCCYKSSKPVLRQHVFGIAEHKVILREDAGVAAFTDDHVYVVKIESHNHPSAIEPYGGAATGVGGILRDVVCMGAQPIALADVLFFAPPDLRVADIPKGVKHPLYLLGGVVAGIRDYGNRVGVPTVAGGVHFHPGYLGNPLVNVGCLGVAPRKNIVRSISGPPGSVFILAGGLTGRDGIHGVTFASREIGTDSHEDVPAVQLGDPITKEPLIHACLELCERSLLLGMKDLGGGGLSCAAGEMSHAAGVGARIHLDKVPTKAGGMKPWEVWVSESQERMLLSVHPSKVDDVLGVFDLWDVTAVALGEAVAGGNVVATWKDQAVFDMDPGFVYGGPEVVRETRPPPTRPAQPEPGAPPDPAKALLGLLADANIACRAPIVRQYDHTVRGATTIAPIGGAVGTNGHMDAAVLKPLADSWKGLAFAAGINPDLMAADAYWGAVNAVDEVARNIAAVGARIDSIVDNLNFANPQKPERMWELMEAARGLGDGARALDVPFLSGNVSLYNESHVSAVPPTPTLLAVGIVDDVRRAVTSDLKGGRLVAVGDTQPDFGGSTYARQQAAGGAVPKPDLARLPSTLAAVHDAIQQGFVRSCHDCSEGGLLVAATEMAIAGDTGIELDLSRVHKRVEVAAFAESPTRWIIESKRSRELVALLRSRDVPARVIGQTIDERAVRVTHKSSASEVPLELAATTWREGLARFIGGGA